MSLPELIQQASQLNRDDQIALRDYINGLMQSEGLQQRLDQAKNFDAFSGLWSEQEAADFEQATAELSTIDKELWREKDPA